MNGKRFIVGGRIQVVLAQFEHEEDGSQDFVGNGDGRTLVSASNDERLELRFEDRRGATSGVGELAKQSPSIEVAFAPAPGLSLAGGFVVARTNTNPGGEAIRVAKSVYIAANLE